MTAIILLNWNGADDTLECLKSLEKAEGDFRVLVADNGSTDDSLERLSAYVESSSLKIDILPLGHNYGFAGGNNRAINYAANYAPDSYLLLNNDTIVEPDSIIKLQTYAAAHPETPVIGPLICYHPERDKIWSCGCRLAFGTRKSSYKNQSRNILDGKSSMPVSFISGCALYADARLVDKSGKLLSERFFFSEEDYEFALRMRQEGVRMAVVLNSVIYHKVSSAVVRVAGKKSLGRDYLYYLGRLLAARPYYTRLEYRIILMLTCFKGGRHIMKYGFNMKDTTAIMNKLKNDAMNLDGVDESLFRLLVVEGTYLNHIVKCN